MSTACTGYSFVSDTLHDIAPIERKKRCQSQQSNCSCIMQLAVSHRPQIVAATLFEVRETSNNHSEEYLSL